MKYKIALSTLLLSGAALAACIYGGVQAAPIDIGMSSLSSTDAWDKIAEGLEDQFGSSYTNLEGNVKVPVKVAFAPAPFPVDMPKNCGETLREAAERIGDNAEALYGSTGGGGGSGGGGYYGGGFYGSGCIAGCGLPTGTVTVRDPERADS